MRLAMVSYFDVGVSYGIGDEGVFDKAQLANPTAILQVGLRNPLGIGISCDLIKEHKQLLQKWRNASKEMVYRKEMELGWSPSGTLSESEFKDSLIKLINQYPITVCELTIFAIGTVFLWLEFEPGIPIEYLHGFSQCFEFAAYTLPISAELRQAALLTISQTAKTNALTQLTKRENPKIVKDADGYEESMLITAFTDLILCIDKDDNLHETELKNALKSHDSEQEEVIFEYHGKIYFGWADCIVFPRDLCDKDETPREQIARMIECIKIAHVFLGTCEAFERLFLNETFSQVSNYVAQTGLIRNSRDLNRLRTLALAVVSLTNYNLVGTVADEDRHYFNLFEKHACIKQSHENIQNRCNLLYNVQSDENNLETAIREQRLQNVINILTGITVISIVIDSLDFYGSKTFPSEQSTRGALLLILLVAIFFLILSIEFEVWRLRKQFSLNKIFSRKTRNSRK